MPYAALPISASQDILRTTMPQGLVRDAILASPAWPYIAAAMGSLDANGKDVARILADAHAAGVGEDQAVAAVTTAAARAPAPAPHLPSPRVPSPPATPLRLSLPAASSPLRLPRRRWGPLTWGLRVSRDLDLGDRASALEQLKVRPAGPSSK
ncbi:hypothetical protein [Streptomyces goshikiensis]|uniref:hypothetical protein n=1 Tax=Streptomyces goshikiensis TaxID=1942 RepID=UPI0036679C8F